MTVTTICADIDGVLAFFLEGMCQALNARFGTTYQPDATHHYWVESWLPAEQADWLTRQFQSPVFYATLAPDFAGIAALNAFHRAGLPIWIVTDRPAAVAEATREWLSRWRVPHDSLVLGPGSKRRTVRRLVESQTPAAFFDDDPRKAAQLPAPGVALYLPRRPFTPRSLPSAVIFDTWGEVLERFGIAPELADVPQLMRRPTR